MAELERGDRIRVEDAPDEWPETYRVHDTDEEDLGLTEVVVVALTAGCDRYTLRQVADNVTLSHEDGAEVKLDDISEFDPMDVEYD